VAALNPAPELDQFRQLIVSHLHGPAVGQIFGQGLKADSQAGEGGSRRGRVEQTLGILSFHRRLVRDYEHRVSSSASRGYWAMTDVMTRRLTGTSVPSWRLA
jgi:hypothetical protein